MDDHAYINKDISQTHNVVDRLYAGLDGIVSRMPSQEALLLQLVWLQFWGDVQAFMIVMKMVSMLGGEVVNKTHEPENRSIHTPYRSASQVLLIDDEDFILTLMVEKDKGYKAMNVYVSQSDYNNTYIGDIFEGTANTEDKFEIQPLD